VSDSRYEYPSNGIRFGKRIERVDVIPNAYMNEIERSQNPELLEAANAVVDHFLAVGVKEDREGAIALHRLLRAVQSVKDEEGSDSDLYRWFTKGCS